MTSPLQHANDLLGHDERAVVLFTDGHLFHRKPDGTGSIGNWRMDPKRDFDRVVIYMRDQEAPGQSWVLTANVVAVAPSTEENRYRIELANIREAGWTDKNWKEFASAGQGPVRYLPAA